MSEEVRGVVLNDAQGLCLQASGDLAYAADGAKSGFFTSIAEKAIDLSPEAADGGETQASASSLPVVRLETTTRTLLVAKVENDGRERTLVLSKPRAGE